MAATGGHAPDSSGLQYVPPDPWSQEKQVASAGYESKLAPSQYYHTGLIPTDTETAPYKEAVNTNYPPPPPPPFQLPSEPDPEPRSWWRRHRKAAIIGACVLLVIIVAAVVGGVVGSRKSSDGSNNSQSSNAPDTNNSNNTTTDKPNPAPKVDQNIIRPNSRLAVAGFRVGAPGEDRFNLRLFYQGQDNLVRYSTFQNQFNWSKPAVAGVDAISGTSLAAAANIQYDPAIIHLYYLDQDSQLMGQNFTNADNAPQAGLPYRAINGKINGTFENARLSTYSPYLLIQEATGRIQAFTWKLHLVDVENATVWEDETKLLKIDSLLGTAGASIVTLPITSEFQDSGAFIYGRGDGTVATYALSGHGDPKGTSWDSAPPLAVPIPKGASIGAFTVARSTSRTILNVNTYILFQATNGTLQMVWQDDDANGWKGPQTFAALDGADKGTDIACVTQTAWNLVDVWLRTVSSINRCYFQSQGAVKEVWFDGQDWHHLGFVPMG